MVGPKYSLREFYKKESEGKRFYERTWAYRGFIPQATATFAQSLLVYRFRELNVKPDGQENEWNIFNFMCNIAGFSLAVGMFHPLYVIAARVQYSLYYPT